jgi:fructokinase
LVIGEELVSVVRRGRTESEHPGGSPMDVAVGLGRLEMPTTLATWIGQDERGKAIRKHLADSGVHLVPGSDGAPHTSTAIATIDDSGAAGYSFDLSWRLPPIPKWLHPAVVHIGSIAAVAGAGADDVLAAAKAAIPTATLTYDPNIRPQAMGTPEQLSLRVQELVALADVVKVSEDDLAFLYPDGEVFEEATHWLESGPGIVVVTKGRAGAVALTASGLWVEVPSAAAVVVDTVGVADAFTAGVIWALGQAGLLGAAKREALRAIGEGPLTEVLEQANRIAAFTVARAGANPPRLSQLPR